MTGSYLAAPWVCFPLSWALCSALFWASAGPAWGQSEGDDAPSGEAETNRVETVRSKADLENLLASLNDSGADEATLKPAADFYRQALQELNAAEAQEGRRKSFEQQLEATPQLLAKYREISRKTPVPIEPLEPTADLATLEQLAAKRERQVREKRERLGVLDSEPKLRAARLDEVPRNLREAAAEAEEATQRTSELQREPAVNALAAAELAFQDCRRQQAAATLAALEAEQRLYADPGAGELLQLQRDSVARGLARHEKRLEMLRQRISQKRTEEATTQQREAQQAAEVERPEALRQLAKENADLTQTRTELAQRQAALERSLSGDPVQKLPGLTQQLESLSTDLQRLRDRVEAGKLSQASGQLLRQERDRIPSIRDLSLSKEAHEEELARVRFEQYGYHDQRIELADLDSEVETALVGIAVADRATLEPEVRSLLETRRKYLDGLIGECQSYAQQLLNIYDAEEKLIAKAQEYNAFVNERVLWIRSCGVLGWNDLRPAAGALAWSLSPNNWNASYNALVRNARRNLPEFVLSVAAVLAMFAVQRQARRNVRTAGEEAGKRSSLAFRPTIRAAWNTLLIALAWPVLLWSVGCWLEDPAESNEFIRSLAFSLRWTAVCFFLVEVVRNTCRAGGLAERHFDWPQPVVVQARRQLQWLDLVVLPLALWTIGLEVQSIEPLWSSSLGRALFFVTCGLTAVALGRALLLSGSPFRSLLRTQSEGWLVPFHRLWTLLVALSPVALSIAALAGYYYTAWRLSVRLGQTAAVAFGLLLVGAVLQRWLLVHRRRLAREQARVRRTQHASTDAANSPFAPEPSEEAVDLAALSEQTLKLLHTTLVIVGIVSAWFIWGEMSDAMQWLGAASVAPIEGSPKWSQLLGFVAAVAATYVFVRDIPALLELVVLQHLPLDNGARYASASICRYLVAVLGVVLASATLGIGWGDVQWLVAAISVGLGFGLQEIFANFVSGVILLFERPIRVGDVITLGDKTGVVTRIRIRATTITDWDRKEYVVPNKDLVTERLLNWTLSDRTNRIVVRVGVAYGSDTSEACRLMLEACAQHPRILTDPAPVATFDGFGDSSLSLTLRCFLPDLDHRLQTIHELHQAIDLKFRAANIEIAFPQRDLNIRMLPEGWAAERPGGATLTERPLPQSLGPIEPNGAPKPEPPRIDTSHLYPQPPYRSVPISQTVWPRTQPD